MMITITLKMIIINLIIWKVLILIVTGSPLVTKIKTTTIKLTKSPIKIDQRQQLSDSSKLSGSGTLNYCDKSVCYEHDGQDLGCFDPWPLTIKFNFYSLCPQSPSIISPQFMIYSVDQPENPIKLTISNDQSFDVIQSMDKIVFFAHGYRNTYNDSRFISLKDQLLTVAEVVIMVDYSIGADPGITSKVTDFYNFHQAAANTQVVGRQIAILLQKIKLLRNIDYNNVHLIGFSMGSSVGHFMGSYALRKLGFQVGRITALDPPGILIFGSGKHLDPSDAVFVDVIHTTSFNPPWDISKAGSGKVGTYKQLGHIDFYPNGGGENDVDQPGCAGIDWCSHAFSVELMKASIQNCHFPATSCSSYQIYSSGQCHANPKDSRLGYWSVKDPGRGRYYLSTTKNPESTC